MIGQIINNTYRIEQKIGEGGMGAVYRGRDLILDRNVAIKSLRPELAQQSDLVSRFREEARTLARLNHTNVTAIYSFLPHSDNFVMVMEFVAGKPLDKILEDHGALDVTTAARLFCQALEGVAQAHALGIIHRDIKPANLLVTAHGEVKVTDFGIARVLGTARQTRTGKLIGTLEYMSPEQVRGKESDARSDVYALGILLYEMVTGRVPFNCDSDFELINAQVEQNPPPPREFNAELPASVEMAILRALAKDPAARFQTVNEFRAAIINAVPETVTATEPIRLWEEPVVKETRQAFDLSEVISLSGKAGETAANNSPIAAGNFSQQAAQAFDLKKLAFDWFGRFDKKQYAAAATVVLALTVGWGAYASWNPEPASSLVKPTPTPFVVQPTPAPVEPVPDGNGADLFNPSQRPSVVEQPGEQTDRRTSSDSTTRTGSEKSKGTQQNQNNQGSSGNRARTENSSSARQSDQAARLEKEEEQSNQQEDKKKKEEKSSKKDKVKEGVQLGVGIWCKFKRCN